MKQLKPNDISVMRTAIGLYAQPFGVESFAVMLSEDKTEPKSEEERVTRPSSRSPRMKQSSSRTHCVS